MEVHAPVVVTVLPVGMMEVPVHDVVHMVRVRDPGMPAAGAVVVVARVLAAFVLRRASRRMLVGFRKGAFVHVVRMVAVEVAVVEVVRVAVVLEARVAASGTVVVDVVVVGVVGRHRAGGVAQVA